MEFDQLLYKGVLRLIRKVKEKPVSPEQEKRTAYLSVHKHRLQLFAQLLNQEKIHIHVAEDVGGWKGNTFFLPASYYHGPSLAMNVQFYLFRVAFMSVQRRLGLNWTRPDHTAEASLHNASHHAGEVLDVLFEEFPAMREVVAALVQAERAWQKQHGNNESCAMLWGKWMYEGQAAAVADKVKTPENVKREGDDAEERKAMTEKAAPAHEDVELLTVNKEEQADYNLTHNFEKIETVQEFSGKWRDFDGSDDLDEHAEALQELKLRHLVRVNNPVHSLYRSDFVLATGIGESADAEIKGYTRSYNEWNYRERAYRQGYCKMFVRTEVEQRPDYFAHVLKHNRSALTQMRKQFTSFYNEYAQTKRQPYGKDPDLDALVEVFTDLKAGRTPSQNVYIDERKKQKDIAILLLMDVSLSTDGYAGGQRILDVEKQSLLLAGEVFAEYNILFQVDGFSSRTRNNCDYIHLKTFHDDWNKGRNRIAAVEPHGYTRIGPAIRHASWILQQARARNKWLLILSDGKPNDYDQYEGRYGIEDVRQAIYEARQEQVRVSAIAIDVDAKFYLPQMLGQGAYKILPHPSQLPSVLLGFYKDLLKR
jgi:nitric oxide reductase NorD protein